MNAWLLAAILCAPASAQVFETGGAAGPIAPVPGSAGAGMGTGSALSPISAVPGASSLAPSLTLASGIRALPDQPVPAGALRLAPASLPMMMAAASASPATAAPSQAPAAQTDAAPAQDIVPPTGAGGRTSLQGVAAERRRGSGSGAAPNNASASLDGVGSRLSAPLDEAAGSDQAEGAAALGRKVFDRAGDSARLADGSAAGTPGASAAGASPESRDPLTASSAGGSAAGETLRDAVASPIPAAAAPGGALSFFRVPASLIVPSRGAQNAPGAAPAAAPISFARLVLELGEGLVVKVRAVLGFSPVATLKAGSAATRIPAPEASVPQKAGGAIASTEYLERRGLLESLSVAEAAATQEAAALLPAAGIARSRVPELQFAPATPPNAPVLAAPLPEPPAPVRVPAIAWWSLAFLPLVLVLFNEFL